MKINFLPAEQQRRNDRIIDKLRRIGMLLFLLFLVTLGLGARFRLWPPATAESARVTSDDGTTVADVYVLSPDYVLAAAELKGSGQFLASGERIAAHVVSSEAFEGTVFTLLRLNAPTNTQSVVIAVIDPNDQLVAFDAGQEWRGVAQRTAGGGHTVAPEFNLNPGTAVFRDADRSALVGFVVRSQPGFVVIAAKDVSDRFQPAMNR